MSFPSTFPLLVIPTTSSHHCHLPYIPYCVLLFLSLSFHAAFPLPALSLDSMPILPSSQARSQALLSSITYPLQHILLDVFLPFAPPLSMRGMYGMIIEDGGSVPWLLGKQSEKAVSIRRVHKVGIAGRSVERGTLFEDSQEAERRRGSGRGEQLIWSYWWLVQSSVDRMDGHLPATRFQTSRSTNGFEGLHESLGR